MTKINAPLDTLKDIILLYANTPPTPIENLRLIEQELLAQSYLDASGQGEQIWQSEGPLSPDELHYRIETIIALHSLGLEKAEAISDDPASKDKFLEDILGYTEIFPPTIEWRRKLFDSCFYEVYGYTVSSYCPCNFAKMNILAENGFVTASEDLGKSTWIKDRLSCLECGHLQFVAILDDFTKGSYHHLSESEIVAKYNKTSIEEVMFCNMKQPLRKVSYYSYIENDAAWPSYLKEMPCNLLIDLLSSGYNPKKIKRCPHCEKFFFAKDTKRLICYEPECLRAMEREKKKHQRDVDPVKYT